jgi:hypothetical protein
VPKKKKKKKKTCPAALRIFFGWVGMRARPFLFACREPVVSSGHPAGLLSLSLSLSPSLLRLFFSFACACWRWLELCCFLGTDAEARKDRDQISSASTLEQLCCAFHKLSCVVCEAQKKKKKKQRNKTKML